MPAMFRLLARLGVHLAGLLPAVTPQQWSAVIRGLLHSEGWMPPMMIVAAFGIAMGVNAGFGLLGGNALVKAFNQASVVTWFAVAILACVGVWLRSARRLVRSRFAGWMRPRWWFEIARAAWISALLCGCSAMLLFALDVRAERAERFLFSGAEGLTLAFFVAATVGYAVSWWTGRPRRGRAYECVQFFYGVGGAVGVVTMLAIAIPAGMGRLGDAATVALCIAGVTVMTAVLLAIGKRMEKQTAGVR